MSEPIETPWNRAMKSKSKLQEERTGKMRGGRPQVNSGRIWSSLRDNKLTSFIGMFLIDNKTTEEESYTITRRDWRELRRDANRTPPGCLPALQIDIKDVRLLVMETDVWDEITRYVLDLETKLQLKG